MVQDSFVYVGDELDLFAHARNWKRYWSRTIASYVGATVLDVGAGIGATAELLVTPSIVRWLGLEPDSSLAERMAARVARGELSAVCEVRVGFLADLPEADLFDTILYADVLEHIKEDRAELERASRHLMPGGHIVVLSPAHQWLFTPFDQAIGHYRRYDRRSLRAATPPSLELVRAQYIDSIGVLASAANRFILRSSSPTLAQIQAWDTLMVPASRLVDPLLGHTLGKSIIGIWRAAKS